MKELLESQKRLLADDKRRAQPTERMSLEDFKKLSQDNSAASEAQTEILGGVESSLKDEKVIQLSQQTEMAKARLAAEELSETTHEDLEKLNDTLEKALLKPSPESNVDKLGKIIKNEIGSLVKSLSPEKGEAVTNLALGSAPVLGPMERMMDKFEKFKRGFTRENITQKALEKINVGGIFNKAIAKEQWVESQKASGSTASRSELVAQFPKVNQLRREMLREQDVLNENLRRSGLKENEYSRTQPGIESAARRQALSEQYATLDIRAPIVDPVEHDLIHETTAKIEEQTRVEHEKTAQKEHVDKTERQLKKDTAIKAESREVSKDKKQIDVTEFSDENQLEASRMEETQTSLLEKIEENTRPSNDKDKPEKPDGSGNSIIDKLLGGLMGFLGNGLKSAFKLLFNPRNLLKVLSKVALPVMIIGAIGNGIIDAFKTFFNGGSFADALIAGLGGVLEFLTFGLIDANTIKSIKNFFTGLVDDYLVKPITNFINMIGDAFKTYIVEPIEKFFEPVTNFFKDIVNNVTSFFENFEIPGISVTIPIIDKEISLGPWHPFKSEDTAQTNKSIGANQQMTTAEPVVSAPATANAVYNKSAENAQTAVSNQNGTAPVVISAPVQNTNVNNNQNISMPKPTRNSDSGFNSYLKDNAVFV